jgi:hypothetical protein
MLNNFNLFFENNICYNGTSLTKILPMIAFIIGFLIFRFLFYKENSNEKIMKIQMSEKYLKEYEKENEDFFFGDENNTN